MTCAANADHESPLLRNLLKCERLHVPTHG